MRNKAVNYIAASIGPALLIILTAWLMDFANKICETQLVIWPKYLCCIVIGAISAAYLAFSLLARKGGCKKLAVFTLVGGLLAVGVLLIGIFSTALSFMTSNILTAVIVGALAVTGNIIAAVRK